MAVSPSTASKCWWGRPAQPSGSSSTNPRRMPRTHHGLTRAPKTGSTFADDAQCHLRPSGFRDRTLRVRHLLYLLSHPTGGDRLTRARKGPQISNPARSSRRGFLLVREGTHDEEKNGRASCRERGCQYEEMTVVAVSLKKQKIKRKNN